MLDLDPIEARVAANADMLAHIADVAAHGDGGEIERQVATAACIDEAASELKSDLTALVREVQHLREQLAAEADLVVIHRKATAVYQARAERAEAQLAILTQERDAEILRARTAEAEVKRLRGGAFGRLMDRHGEVLTERNRFHAALRDIAHGAYDGDRCAEIARQAIATQAQGAEAQAEGVQAEEAAKGVK